MKRHMKMLALGGMFVLGTTLGCSADMAQGPYSASQPYDSSDIYAETAPYECSYQPTEENVQGELVKIDGDYYVLRDSVTNKEVRFHIDKNATRLSGDGERMAEEFQLGDWIQAQLTPDGDALSLQEARVTPSVLEQPLP